jgi:dipeptidyl aminopeptidase/acylaminoacyl peptidase
MRTRHSRLAALLIVLTLAPALAANAIAQAAKRPVSYDAYDSWMSIRGTKVSNDGTWLAYALAAQEDDGSLVVRNLKTGAEFRHARGESPVITADGRFVVFTIVPAKADVDKAKKDKKKPEDMPKNALGIMSLADGTVQTVDRVKSFRVPELAPSWVAYLKEKAPAAKDAPKADDKPAAAESEKPAEKKPKEKKKDPGTDLVIRNLATGVESTVPEVVEYGWNRDGSWLAYGVSSKAGDADGAFARKTSDGAAIALHTGKGNYKGFEFDEAGTQLAFVSDQAEYASAVSPYRAYYWTAGANAASEIVSASTAGMPQDFAVSEHGSLRFSKDGARLFLGTAPKPEPERDEDAPAPLKVDLWHWKDPQLQPMQQVRATQTRERNFRGVVHLKDKRFVQLALPDLPSVAAGDDPSYLLGQSDVPYQQLISWDGSYDDVFVVNVGTGERTKVLERSYYGASLSPGGKYVMYFDEATQDWWSYRISDGKRTNMTASVEAAVRWEDEKHDTPNQPSPYGIAGWTAGDKNVLVYDRYDIWSLDPDGGTAPRNATSGAGRAAGLVFRYQRLDPEERVIPADKPVLLDTTNDRTKASGFYRTTLASPAKPVEVVMMDKAFGTPIKAKNADVAVYTLSRFEEFPNLWTSDLSFRNPQKVSDANPQQAQYVWGTSELIDYVNSDGKTLRAILTKPDNFDPSKKYPLMVYIYEELSQGLHSYAAPAPGTSINIARYVSNGYIVLRPDIVYDTGYPGEAAEKCVLPAVQTVLAMGFVDPKRVGIQGHSWGGYQITHLITRTDIFAAVEAGASVANMISAYGGIRWGTGMSRAFQYEHTQSRIGGPPWDNTLEYIENSPIFWVEKVHTPYLTIHNDEDDAVPWYQGIEFFSALRRLGKEAYFFNYNTEKHGLRQRENQKHWTVHMDEFFDHFLKGAPTPDWMEHGLDYLHRGTRDVSDLYKKKVPTDSTQGGR